MQMLVAVITVISIWFGYRVSMERSINQKPVTLLGTLDVSGMVCVCVCVCGRGVGSVKAHTKINITVMAFIMECLLCARHLLTTYLHSSEPS